jgi:hypothetical protein
LQKRLLLDIMVPVLALAKGVLHKVLDVRTLDKPIDSEDHGTLAVPAEYVLGFIVLVDEPCMLRLSQKGLEQCPMHRLDG